MSEFFDFFGEQEKKSNGKINNNRNINCYISDKEAESEDENFTRALNKKVFQGKKGQMLMELQKSYKEDNRFIMDKKFQGDLDITKVSLKLREMTYAFDENNVNKTRKKINFTKNIDNKAENRKEAELAEEINIIAHNLSLKNFTEAEFREKLEDEKMRNLSILSSIISNQEFLSLSKKVNNPSQLLLKRFDPNLNIGQNLIVEKEKKKIEENKNLIKLGKGMEIRSEFNVEEEFANKKNKKEMKKLNQLRKQDKERVMKKIANEVNDYLEPVIEVNYDIWKNVTKKKSKKAETFSLFSNSDIKEHKKEEAEKVPKETAGNNNKSFGLFDDNNINNKDEKKSFSLFDGENKKNDVQKSFSLFDGKKPSKGGIENEKNKHHSKEQTDECKFKIKDKKIKEKEKTKYKINHEMVSDNNKDKIKDKSKNENNKNEVKSDFIRKDLNLKEKEVSDKTDYSNKEAILDPKAKEKIKDPELLKKKRERTKEKKEAFKREEIKKSNCFFLLI